MPRFKNIKPYAARAKLKSIYYWQKVVSGELPPKRPLVYYQNHLKFFSDEDIAHLEAVAKIYLSK